MAGMIITPKEQRLFRTRSQQSKNKLVEGKFFAVGGFYGIAKLDKCVKTSWVRRTGARESDRFLF